MCSTSTSQATLGQPPSGTTSEWARFLTLNLVQGEIQETLHPNAYGQQALGRCLTLAVDGWAGTRKLPAGGGRGAERGHLHPLRRNGYFSDSAAKVAARA